MMHYIFHCAVHFLGNIQNIQVSYHEQKNSAFGVPYKLEWATLSKGPLITTPKVSCKLDGWMVDVWAARVSQPTIPPSIHQWDIHHLSSLTNDFPSKCELQINSSCANIYDSLYKWQPYGHHGTERVKIEIIIIPQ